MNKIVWKKRIGIIVDITMYVLLLLQMAYVFTGNNVHEWLGIGFFVLLIIHLIIKKYWFASIIKRKIKINSLRGIADIVTIILFICIATLMISSMGVSRTIFPDFMIFNDPFYHRMLATIVLTIAVIHGGFHVIFKAKNKKKAVVYISILAIIAFCIGMFGVPYLNRHMRIVEIDSSKISPVDKYEWSGKKPLVVYFSRIGNTDFEDDVDAVSGASLLLEDGKLTGNTEFIAKTLKSILDCEIKPITLTEYKYPSSYSETCVVGGNEIKDDARPKIEPIDVSEYDSIILVYPIWWGTIPMPVATFLEENDFAGKEVYFMATQGSSGFASSVKDAKQLIKDAKVYETISIYCDDIPKSGQLIKEWLNNK